MSLRPLPATAVAVAALGVAAPGAHAANPAGDLASGLLAPVLEGQHVQGAVPPSTPRDLTLVLASRDPAALKAFVADPGHPSLSPAQFAARFGPSAAAVGAVRGWASSAGLRVDSVSANRSVVKLSGTAGTLGRALGISFARVQLAGSSVVAARGTAGLPSRVRAVTSAVLGLNDAGRVSVPHRAGAAAASAPSSYGPKQLAALYGAGGANDGSGQAVSIITAGKLDGPRADLAAFEDRYGLPRVTWDQTDVGTPSTDTAGNPEWDLDSQYSTGLAPGVRTIHVYNGTSLSNEDILATVNRWVSEKKTTQASFSAGECESLAQLTGFASGLDTVLAQAAAQGQTLFTSSGDTGSQCPVGPVGVNGLPIGLPGTNFPASSPAAIGVGGTTVTGSGPQETSWIAGGGGISLFEATPAYQKHAGGSFVGLRRGVPDVALDADPASGYEVVVDGQVQTIGGTSASAPAWQAIWARAQAARNGTLGFAGPAIYNAPAADFNDVTIGTNTLFPATPGYDYDTGRGTPRIERFVADVR